MLADDDVILNEGFEEILEYAKKHDFLFSICNSVDVINGELTKVSCYNQCPEIMDPLEAVDFFIYEKPMKIFPMIPYFGGILVNLELMREVSTPEERNIFCGTFHQYIGGLWRVLLQNKNDKRFKVGMLGNPIVAIGADSDKTWYPYLSSVMEKMEFYYDNLGLDSLKRKHISVITKCSGRFTHYLYKPVVSILNQIGKRGKNS